MNSATDVAARSLCAGALLFMLAGGLIPIRQPVLGVSPVPAVNADEAAIEGNGFKQDGVYPGTPAPPHRGSVDFYGSWMGTDASTGTVHTRWFRAVPKFAIYISGYLNTPGNHLAVEVANADGSTDKLRVPPELAPGERWWVKEMALPRGNRATKFRIVAVDSSTATQGWLGFSEPFLIQSSDAWQTAKQFVMVVLVSVVSVVLLFGPGFVLRECLPKMSIIWLPAPGIALLAVLGLVTWLASGVVKPRYVSRIGLTAILLTVAYRIFRTPLSRAFHGLERRALAILLLVICIAIAKSVYSLGPAGELYAGRISRTLEVGGRSDSRMPFHAVQLVAVGESPKSNLARMYYYPWDFSSRGVIASLVVAPIVLSSPVRVGSSMPDAAWQLFDPDGFMAYRIAMVVLAACVLVASYGLACYVLPGDWSYFAFLVVATAPFVMHELYFTWPKLLAATFVLWAAYLILRGRWVFAGLLVGLGYLAHPSALMWLPALLGLALIHKRTPRILLMLAGTAACVLFWQFVNRGHSAQGFFLSYLTMHSGYPASVLGWLLCRRDSLMNTVVPFLLFFHERNDAATSSLYESSPQLIRFFFQYWNTLPWGIGIGFFLTWFIRAAWIGVARQKAYFWLVFALPFALFVVYWGAGNSGLMREGLHAWVVGLLIATVAAWQRYLPASLLLWAVAKWALALRGIEILAVLLLPTLATNSIMIQKQFAFSDTIALIVMLAGTALLTAQLIAALPSRTRAAVDA